MKGKREKEMLRRDHIKQINFTFELQIGVYSKKMYGDLSLPLGLALGSPIFPSGCEGKLGVALESLQGRRDLT